MFNMLIHTLNNDCIHLNWELHKLKYLIQGEPKFTLGFFIVFVTIGHYEGFKVMEIQQLISLVVNTSVGVLMAVVGWLFNLLTKTEAMAKENRSDIEKLKDDMGELKHIPIQIAGLQATVIANVAEIQRSLSRLESVILRKDVNQ